MDYANDVLFSEKQSGYGSDKPTTKSTRLADDVGSKALGCRATTGADGSVILQEMQNIDALKFAEWLRQR